MQRPTTMQGKYTCPVHILCTICKVMTRGLVFPHVDLTAKKTP